MLITVQKKLGETITGIQPNESCMVIYVLMHSRI